MMVRLMKQSHSLFAAYIKPLENLTCRGLVLAIFFTCKRIFLWFPFFFSFQITCTTMPVNLIALYFLCPPFNFFFVQVNSPVLLLNLFLLDCLYLILIICSFVKLHRFTTGLAATLLLWPTNTEQIH